MLSSLLPFLQHGVLALQSWALPAPPGSGLCRLVHAELCGKDMGLEGLHRSLVLSYKPFLNLPTNVSEYVADLYRRHA